MDSLQYEQLTRYFSPFLVDREAQGLSPKTLQFYRCELPPFLDWLDGHELTADAIRTWLLQLSERRNPGGVHASYRAIRAFLRWLWQEYELDAPNPIAKVRAPKRPQELLAPVSLDVLKAMLDTCQRKTPLGDRDRAIIMTLLDTGLRASEFCALNIGDVDMATGAVIVRKGKGGKDRVAFISATTRRELARYLRYRRDARDDAPLFATESGGRLTYSGLRQIVRRRAQAANLDRPPSLHSFRRAFALLSLRNGADIYSLQKLMGHADLSVLRRYLCQTEGDLQAVHERTSPVAHWRD